MAAMNALLQTSLDGIPEGDAKTEALHWDML
jgi:hypothetical protein